MFKSEEAIWSSNDYNHLLMAPAPSGDQSRLGYHIAACQLHGGFSCTI
jgi:hypothetical protein